MRPEDPENYGDLRISEWRSLDERKCFSASDDLHVPCSSTSDDARHPFVSVDIVEDAVSPMSRLVARFGVREDFRAAGGKCAAQAASGPEHFGWILAVELCGRPGEDQSDSKNGRLFRHGGSA